MRRTARAGLMLTALTACAVAAAPAGAVEAPKASTTVGEVVVHGRQSAKLPAHAPDVIWKDVQVRAQPAHTGNLSRWMKAVCPGVFGLTPSYASFVVRRITDVAREYAPAWPRCRRGINLLVAFTSTPQAMMDDVREHRPLLLGYHYADEEKTLAIFHGPIQAWYVTATNGYLDYAYGRGAQIGGVVPGETTGRLRNGQVNAVVFVLIVVDTKAIEDQAIGAVADHVAALALSKTAARKGCGPLPSILDALDPACPQSASLETLSTYDRSFLKALYASNPEEAGLAERGSVTLGVLRDLKGSPKTKGK